MIAHPREGGAGQTSHTPRFYTPGYTGWKLMMILLGAAIFLFGCSELWTPLRLSFFGIRTDAVATRVIEIRQGFPDLFLTDDLQVRSAAESGRRAGVFWNEFNFQTSQGKTVTVRSGIGSQLKPLYPLLDADGLPSTVLLCYDPGNPETFVLPGTFSTWFAPAALTVLGLGCAVIGAFLLYWARTPIEMPHIAAAESPGGEPDP